jgi:uncharacterized membrane protein
MAAQPTTATESDTSQSGELDIIASPEPPVAAPSSAAPSVESRDLTLGAATYFMPIIGLMILKTEVLKAIPYLRRHAIQGIALCIVLIPLSLILSIIPVIGYLAPIAWLGITGFYAYEAYEQKAANIPLITNLCTYLDWF